MVRVVIPLYCDQRHRLRLAGTAAFSPEFQTIEMMQSDALPFRFSNI